MEGIGGDILRCIALIRKSDFIEGPALPGIHEVVGQLDDFERAVVTYLMSTIKSLFEKVRTRSFKESEDLELLKSEIMAMELKKVLLSKFLWFIIFDRLNLWDKRTMGEFGINKGKSVVILNPDFISDMERSSDPNIQAVKIESIDDLPEEVKEALTRLVLSSSDFKGRAGQGPINNN